MLRHLALLGLVVHVAGCAAPERLNVVFISIDTLRADRLGCYGYERDTSPEIDELASDSVLWETAYSPMSQTLPSHLALLTSTHPETNRVRRNRHVFRGGPTGIRTLTEMLASRGYETAGFVSASPLKAASGINVGFQTWEQPARRQRSADETTDRALQWLALERSKPFFLFVHYYDPHTLRVPHPELDSIFPADDAAIQSYLDKRQFPADRPALLEANALYDGEVRFTSLHVGRLLAGLRELDLYRDAAIVLVSDHGEGIGQHDRGNHGMNWEEQIHVPLMVHFPERMNLNGQRRSGLASLLDVVPTLVGALDLSLEPEAVRQFQGIDLFDSSEARRYVLTLREIPNNPKKEPGRGWAMTTDEWKYFTHTVEPDRLYHRPADPYETRNVIDANENVAARMKGAIENLLSEHEKRSMGAAVPEEVDATLLEELRALGYVD